MVDVLSLWYHEERVMTRAHNLSLHVSYGIIRFDNDRQYWRAMKFESEHLT